MGTRGITLEVEEHLMPVQVRAGTGGDEAALFAGDLLRMYERAAALNGWRFEVRWPEDS